MQSIYSSAFIRAKQTAEETSKILGEPIEIFRDFGELNVGRLVPESEPRQALVFKAFGTFHKILPPLIGSTLTKRLLGYFFIVFYFGNWYAGKTVAGEPPEEAIKRIENVFKALTERHGSSDKVAVFTHGYFIHLLVNHVLDPKRAPLRMLKTPYIRNGSITHITRTRKGGWKVRAYAQTAQLQ